MDYFRVLLLGYEVYKTLVFLLVQIVSSFCEWLLQGLVLLIILCLWGWGSGSVVEHLPSMRESRPHTT